MPSNAPNWLKPCPFCARPLSYLMDPPEQVACRTPQCFGRQLGPIVLSDLAAVTAFNTRLEVPHDLNFELSRILEASKDNQSPFRRAPTEFTTRPDRGYNVATKTLDHACPDGASLHHWIASNCYKELAEWPRGQSIKRIQVVCLARKLEFSMPSFDTLIPTIRDWVREQDFHSKYWEESGLRYVELNAWRDYLPVMETIMSEPGRLLSTHYDAHQRKAVEESNRFCGLWLSCRELTWITHIMANYIARGSDSRDTHERNKLNAMAATLCAYAYAVQDRPPAYQIRASQLWD